MKNKILATFLALLFLASNISFISEIPVYATELTKSENLTPFEVRKDMDEIVKYVQETDSYPADWVAWFRARTEDEIYLHDAIKSNIGNYYDTVNNNKPWDDVGGLTRATITIRSMREMPTQFRVPGTINDGIDITAYLLNIPEKKYMDRPNMSSWMLLSLNNLFDFNFNRENLKNLREKLITDLVDGTAKNGGWGLSSNSEYGGVDVTGFVLASLAPYKDRPDVKAAIDKGVEFMRQVRGNDIIMECNNSMSFAMMVWGLSEVGVDVMDGTWEYNSTNPIEELYKYKVGNQFKWKLDGSVDSWATMQVQFALLSYIASRHGKMLLNFNSKWIYSELPAEEKPEPPVEPEVPCTHKDENKDDICDLCGENLNDTVGPETPCKHKDEDKNNICDLCGEKLDDTEKPLPPVVNPEKPNIDNSTTNTTTNNSTTNNNTANNNTTNHNSTTNSSTHHTTNTTTNNITNNTTTKNEIKDSTKTLATNKTSENLGTTTPISNTSLLASPSVIDPIFIKIGLVIAGIIALSLASLAITSIIKVIPRGKENE
ncbi:MAG: hypothetical protein ACRCTZ_02450 [Sarcina sp.]